jgi:hypothetical protein
VPFKFCFVLNFIFSLIQQKCLLCVTSFHMHTAMEVHVEGFALLRAIGAVFLRKWWRAEIWKMSRTEREKRQHYRGYRMCKGLVVEGLWYEWGTDEGSCGWKWGLVDMKVVSQELQGFWTWIWSDLIEKFTLVAVKRMDELFGGNSKGDMDRLFRNASISVWTNGDSLTWMLMMETTG